MNERIDFRRLRCFLVLAEELHFGRAAKRLNMTQPPLSVALRGLENELGVRLLERSTRRVRLSPAGALLKQRGEALFDELQRTTRLVRALGQGKSGSIGIGFVGVATLLGAAEAVRRYRNQEPAVVIDLQERPTAELLERLRREQLDAVFVRVLGPVDSAFSSRRFAQADYGLAIPADHPLRRRKRVSVRDLDGQQLLFFPRTLHPAVYDDWLARFEQANVRPRIVQEIRTLQTELTLVAAGMGIALIAEPVKRQLPHGVVWRKLSGPRPVVDVHVVWRKDDTSPVVAGFLSLLEQRQVK
jgi:DNA-binding transcriptional LysR family regulator